MAQYAYIPNSQLGQVQQSYSIVHPENWSFVRGGVQYNGAEEHIFTPDQKAEIIALGGQWFSSAQEFTLWSSGSETLAMIDKDLQYGLRFRLQIIQAIKDQSMTNADRLSLLNKIKDGMNSLDYGDVAVSRAVFNAIATDATLYTAARKAWILQQIDNYLTG